MSHLSSEGHGQPINMIDTLAILTFVGGRDILDDCRRFISVRSVTREMPRLRLHYDRVIRFESIGLTQINRHTRISKHFEPGRSAMKHPADALAWSKRARH
jgi:hypothetical protein